MPALKNPPAVNIFPKITKNKKNPFLYSQLSCIMNFESVGESCAGASSPFKAAFHLPPEKRT